jgi:hypothetical protein
LTAIGTPFQTNSESSYAASYAVGIVRGNNSLFTVPWHFANSRSFASLRMTTNYGLFGKQ